MNDTDMREYHVIVLHTLSVILGYLDVLSQSVLQHLYDEQMIPIREQARIAVNAIGQLIGRVDTNSLVLADNELGPVEEFVSDLLDVLYEGNTDGGYGDSIYDLEIDKTNKLQKIYALVKQYFG